jgi:ABC-type sulfate transport system substrate-binding protein
MTVLYIVGGLVLLAIIWAIVKSSSGKSSNEVTHAYDPPAKPTYEAPEKEYNRAYDWKDGSKATVSSSFGKGGIPTGTSYDKGTAVKGKYDEDLEMLKNARPFEPKALPTSVND